MLFTATDGTKVDDVSYKATVESTLGKLKGQEGIGIVTDFYNTGSQAFVSNDGQSTYAIVGFKGDEVVQMATMKRVRPLLSGDQRWQVKLGGSPAFSQELTDQMKKDLERAESLTFPILALLLIVIFGSLVAAVLPLAVGGIAILGGFLLLRVGAEVSDVSVFAINIITMLGLGLAIDYSLFIVNRFREELLRNDGAVQPALVCAMQTAGRTVIFSGLTVATSLLSLLIFPQMFLRSIGLGGALAVLVAMAAAVTILPAALALLGHRVNSLSVWSLCRRMRRQPVAASNGRHGFWYNFSSFVMRYPLAVFVATLVPILVLGLPFLHVRMSVSETRSMPPSSQSRQVGEILAQQFPRNETTPIQAVVHTDAPALSPRGLAATYDYTRQVGEIPGVTRVESLVNLDPRLTKETYAQFYAPANLSSDQRAQRAADVYAEGDYNLVNIYYDYDSTSDAAQALGRRVRQLDPPGGLSVLVGGAPAIVNDFLASISDHVLSAMAIIVVVIFILLFLMLGSLVVPLKAVLLNILSLLVSFGALVWIFQDGHLSDILGFTAIGSIDGTQPVLIFAIAFGLSMDYEVFLLSRIKEHYDKTRNTTMAVAMGVQKTGFIITSAAALLVIVFAGFATAEISQLKQVGTGLTLAVLVDATLVRMLLVPATMCILGRVNWWAPAPLARLYRRLGLSEIERAHAAEEQQTKGEVVPAAPASTQASTS